MGGFFDASILPIGATGEVASAGSENASGVQATPGSIGLCLSGGGSRALTCAMGQLRALHTLGLDKQIFAISSVSGGTWANCLYTYLPASITDEEFLGTPVLDPGKLTIAGDAPFALTRLGPNSLGRVPLGLGILRDLGEILKLNEEWKYPTNELWQGLIGHSVLRPFGLWQPDPQQGHFDPHFFSWTNAYLGANNGLLARNPGLKESDFYTVKRKRPFPVFNTSMFTDDGDTADLMPFEANLMLGVRQKFSGLQGASVGGGFVESFAMSGAYAGDIDERHIKVQPPARRYTLADIVGSSSAAFAQLLEEKYSELRGLVPRYPYFPIAGRESTATRTYRFADGGSLENLGLNVMLARGLGRVLVGVNTDEAVRVIDGEVVVSDDIPPLFGLQPWVSGKGYVRYADDPGRGAVRLFRHNQVFPEQEFDTLKKALSGKKAAGVPLVVRQKLPVLRNDWYGVPAGQVDILWMYNDNVEAFMRQLHLDVRAWIDAESLGDFPLYNTFYQLKLNATDVNALAHLWTWNLAAEWAPPGGASNASVVRDFFSG